MTPWPPHLQPHIDRAMASANGGKGRGRAGNTLTDLEAALLLEVLIRQGTHRARTVCYALGFGGMSKDLYAALGLALSVNADGVRGAFEGSPAARVEA